MFLRWYRKRIAEQVAEKMAYSKTCPNERDAILHIIAPRDYEKVYRSYCDLDCFNVDC